MIMLSAFFEKIGEFFHAPQIRIFRNQVLLEIFSSPAFTLKPNIRGLVALASGSVFICCQKHSNSQCDGY